MYLTSKKESECCGCTACQQVCPTKCITMQTNAEGFSYPVVEQEKCIQCHRCEKVCPFVTQQHLEENKESPSCYYGWHKNAVIRQKSTSGGAYSAIVDWALENGYSHIWGVAYNDKMDAVHREMNGRQDLCSFTRSKYVQSELGDSFQKIRKQLDEKQGVLFSGTPCQIQGLLNCIPVKERENLLTVSLICHGVCSPAMFRRYREELVQKYGSPITDIRFRDKQVIDGKLKYNCTVFKFENGSEQVKTDDLYTICFGRGMMQRESCFQCPFTTVDRNADLSIGDFWGIERNYPYLSSEKAKGISLMLAHTQKGVEICQTIDTKMQIQKVNLQEVLTLEQQQLRYPAVRPHERNRMIKAILQKNGSFEKIGKKELKLWKIENIKNRVIKKTVSLFHCSK